MTAVILYLFSWSIGKFFSISSIKIEKKEVNGNTKTELPLRLNNFYDLN